MIPSFQADGLLPPGDYEVSFEELRRSILTMDPGMAVDAGSWDAPWRERLVDNFEVLTRQLWSVGVRDVFADGSFVKDKDHPNDIDGYFVCGLTELATGTFTQQLNLLDPYKVWTWDPLSRNLIGATPRGNFPCGIGIVWNSTRMCQALEWAAALETSTGTNSNFRQPFVNLDAMAPPGEFSKSNIEVRHDSQ